MVKGSAARTADLSITVHHDERQGQEQHGDGEYVLASWTNAKCDVSLQSTVL
jgi:hypothetical protein